ncbi:MAG TPA: substrate-binding protein [Streptosporangiaceae bacterium]|nr:substrate-binding protein [Streptosporangiaceae bacterium]
MQAIALIADSHLAVPPDEAFWLFGRGGQSGWLLGAACDAVRPGAAVSLRLPAGLGSPAAVDILGRIGACVPGRLIEIVHDQPWQGRLRLKFKPAPAGGTRFSVSAELDSSGLAWLMDRRGWAPGADAGAGGIGPARADVHRLGLLTSKSGPGAVFAVACDYLARLAVEEINAEGGLHGQPVDLVVRDDATDSGRAGLEAGRLAAAGCRAIVASVTSASFEAAQRVVGEAGPLLLYPLLNEGGAAGGNVLRWGERPLDQVLAVAGRMMKGTGSRHWYLVGNDYSWSHGAHLAAMQAIESAGGQVVGGVFTPLGTTDFSSVIDGIRGSRAALIVSSLVGADEVAFERQAWSSGLRQNCDVLSLALEESTRERVGDDASIGIWTAFGYFEAIEDAGNRELCRRYREAYGRWAPPISTFAESVYEAILLYAAAVRGADDRDETVRRLQHTRASMPRGPVAAAGPGRMSQRLRVARAVPGGFRLVNE